MYIVGHDEGREWIWWNKRESAEVVVTVGGAVVAVGMVGWKW